MSDIMIHISSSINNPQAAGPTAKQKKNRNKFLKRMKEKKGYPKDKQSNPNQRSSNNHNQSSNQNGPFTKYPLPPTAGGSRASTSSFNLPPKTSTVINAGSNEKPKQPVSTKTTAVASCPPTSSSRKILTSTGNPTKYLAIDCEMVGTGPKGSISKLARCSIVSYDGDVVYDKFIKPDVPVTDYRTRWSGVRPRDLFKATPYAEARREILRLLMGKIIIGHAIHNDFKALSYTHPFALTRDTSKIPLLNLKAGFPEKQPASLKRLTKAIFNRDIQTGKKGHSSVEDAKATMELYKVVEEEWERTLASRSLPT